MKQCEVQLGVHTFEVGQPLTKSQFQAIWDKGRSSGRVILKKTAKAEHYTLQGNRHSAEGIRIVLYSIPKKQVFHVSIQIEPCRVLGSEDPTELFRPSKKSYEKLADLCDQYLNEQNVPGSIRDMKISRCDVTANLMFEHQDYVGAYLRILKKSVLIKGYQAGGFRLDEKKANDPKRANEHSFSMKCKRATLLCYDKLDQMEMTGRASTKLAHHGILRLEAQLKRPALKRHLTGEIAKRVYKSSMHRTRWSVECSNGFFFMHLRGERSVKIGYIRVSTQEQNTVRQEVLMSDLGVEEVYLDRLSGKSTERPELKKMMEYVRRGDTVIVESISRFARNTKDLLELVERLAAKGVEFISQKEAIDTGTPTGKFMLTVFGAVAELEREYILQRQREGIEMAKAQGKYTGRKPVEVKDFQRVTEQWRQGELTAVQAMRKLGLSRSTFYRRVRNDY